LNNIQQFALGSVSIILVFVRQILVGRAAVADHTAGIKVMQRYKTLHTPFSKRRWSCYHGN